MISPIRVTCLTPTTEARRAWIPQLLDIFDSQTFPSGDRELLFVADGHWIHEYCDGRPNVRHVIADGVIGVKRNHGVRFAAGDIVCHFDDDDYSSPERLVDQIERLEASGKAVTGYSAALFTDGAGWWRKYYGPAPFFAFGTSLCYRRQYALDNPFTALQVGEDMAFSSAAAQARQLTSVDARELLIATRHKGNTSIRPEDGPCWLQVPDPPLTLPFAVLA